MHFCVISLHFAYSFQDAAVDNTADNEQVQEPSSSTPAISTTEMSAPEDQRTGKSPGDSPGNSPSHSATPTSEIGLQSQTQSLLSQGQSNLLIIRKSIVNFLAVYFPHITVINIISLTTGYFVD